MIFCSLNSEEQNQMKCGFKSPFSYITEPVRCVSRTTSSCLMFMGGDTDAAATHSVRFEIGSALGWATWNWDRVLLHGDSNEIDGWRRGARQTSHLCIWFGGPVHPSAVPSKAGTPVLPDTTEFTELCVLPVTEDKQNGNFYCLHTFVASLIQRVLGDPSPPLESTEPKHCFTHRTKWKPFKFIENQKIYWTWGVFKNQEPFHALSYFKTSLKLLHT